uniref:Uncharacterized protein n=1 Tax=Anguilla anguilla TaxID=7936 RepID=A0A0E9X032_ANGAN
MSNSETEPEWRLLPSHGAGQGHTTLPQFTFLLECEKQPMGSLSWQRGTCVGAGMSSLTVVGAPMRSLPLRKKKRKKKKAKIKHKHTNDSFS